MLTAQKHVFSEKKKPAGMLTAQKRNFSEKKKPAAMLTRNKNSFSPKCYFLRLRSRNINLQFFLEEFSGRCHMSKKYAGDDYEVGSKLNIF